MVDKPDVGIGRLPEQGEWAEETDDVAGLEAVTGDVWYGLSAPRMTAGRPGPYSLCPGLAARRARRRRIGGLSSRGTAVEKRAWHGYMGGVCPCWNAEERNDA